MRRGMVPAAVLVLAVAFVLPACTSRASVVSVTPPAGESAVSVDALIELELSRTLGREWTGSFDIEPATSGTAAMDGNTVRFAPREALRHGATYTVTVHHTRLQGGSYSWQFTTEAKPGPPVAEPQEPVESPGLSVTRDGDAMFLGPLDGDYFQTLEWLDDGRLLARVNRGDLVQFVLIDQETGDSRVVYEFRDRRHTYLYVSSLLAGDLGVAFIVHGDSPGERGLWHVLLDGEGRLLLPDAAYFHVSPDRSQLLAEGDEGVYHVDARTGSVKSVPQLPQYGFPYSLPALTWSGERVAGEMWTDPTSIYAHDLVEDLMVLALSDPDSHFHSPMWSPDGTALAYLSQPSHEAYPTDEHGRPLPAARVHVRVFPDGATRSLSIRPDGENYGVLAAPMWSPGGTEMLLSVGLVESQGWDDRIRNEIWRYRWADGRAGYSRLTDELSGRGLKLPVSFSPDGLWLLYAVYHEGSLYRAHDLWILEVETGHQIRVGQPGLHIDELVWLPDGRLLGSTTRQDDNARTLSVIDPLAGAAAHLPITGDWIYSLSVSPGSDMVVAVIREGEREILALFPTAWPPLKEKGDGM